jgi:L-seryl-tRNA(Ser) seleniumtransferase
VTNRLRALPSVDRLAMPVARAELAERRAELLAGAGDEVDLVAGACERLRPSLRRVLNATPVVVRTNLGRRTGTHRRWYRPAAKTRRRKA